MAATDITDHQGILDSRQNYPKNGKISTQRNMWRIVRWSANHNMNKNLKDITNYRCAVTNRRHKTTKFQDFLGFHN
jgi:hypothetical protein